MQTVRANAQEAVASVDALLSILGATTEDGANLSMLLPTLASLQAAGSEIVGVKDLLRAWNVLVQRRAANADHVQLEDVVSMTEWFVRLSRYLQGTLPVEERAGLAQLPREIGWLPQMPVHLSAEIERRLSLAPPRVAVIQLQPSITTEAAFSDSFPKPDGDLASLHIAALTPAVQVPVSTERPANDDELDRGTDQQGKVESAANAAAEPQPVSVTELDSRAEPAHLLQDAQAAEPIWISAEERQLVLSAITQDLLPLAEKWAGAEPGHERTQSLDALVYQCELIGNVLEHLGLHRLAHGLRVVREQAIARASDMDPEIVLACCAGVLAAVDHPTEDGAMLLTTLVGNVPGLDDQWTHELAAELVRVRVGVDPAQIAARKREASTEDVTLHFAPDVLASVLEGMLRELPSNTARLGAAVRALVMEDDAASLDEARRVAHTLKGDANTVGIRGLASLTHALEDILVAFEKQGGRPDSDSADLLIDATDKIEEIADFLLGRGPGPEDLLDLYQRLLDTSVAVDDVAARPEVPNKPEIKDDFAAAPAIPQPQAKAASPTPQPATPTVQVRNLTLSSDVLDHLQDLAGEAMIVSQGIDRQLEGVAELRRVQDESARHSQELLTRLDDLVALRGAALQSTAIASGTDLDPLEIDQYNELHVISRQLAEAHADVNVSLRNLRRTLSALADLRSEQEQVNRELQRSILRTRMVPFAQIAPRLQRIARQTAKQVMKQVELEIAGEDTLVDAELLERIVEPLGHLIRNAIDHGVEAHELRQRAGKPDVALVRIAVGTQGDAATIDVSDDGHGLDFEAIRTRATSMGLLEAGAATVDERRLARLVLLPGFSTRETATEISGRGVGMDVVNQRVTELRGTLQLHSRAGQGLDVKIRVPITQTIANVILVSGQRSRTAVVSSAIEQIVDFLPSACRFDETHQALNVAIGDEIVAAIPMESLYREGANVNDWLASGGRGLLVRGAAGDPALVLVRSVDEVRSVVVKPVSPDLPPIPAVRGITQLPDGGLAPVVDLDQLLSRGAEQTETERALRFVPPKQVPRIVVADDSLSARRSLEQLMRDAGYEVDVASDGFETIAQVEARPTAVLLLDMEMPRMSGLEVARNLRNKPESRDLPILMITSRTASKHRLMAEEAGVTQVLGKPVSEDALVTLVADLIATHGQVQMKPEIELVG
jgi:chemotaxis protein histidine kinase CheA/ActR/RegA family two-component response regulator